MPTHTGGDAVTHPSHYNWHPGGIECREVVRHFDFNLGNAIKYVWRAGYKDSRTHIEDLRKAIDYINDEINEVVKAEQQHRRQPVDPQEPPPGFADDDSVRNIVGLQGLPIYQRP